jgi:hypothetical protein
MASLIDFGLIQTKRLGQASVQHLKPTHNSDIAIQYIDMHMNIVLLNRI